MGCAKTGVFLSAASCRKKTPFLVHPKQIFGPPYFVTALDLFLQLLMVIAPCTYLFNRGQKSGDKKGLGTTIPHDLREGDDEFDAYRKRMMVAYRFRPNPLVRIQLIPVYKWVFFIV